MLNSLQKMHLKLLQKKKTIKKIVETTSDLNGIKTADKITRVSKTLPQNNIKTNEETLRKKYISPELRKNKLLMI